MKIPIFNNTQMSYHVLVLDDVDINSVAKYYTYPLGVLSIVLNLSVVISSGLILKSTLQPRPTYMILGNLAFADLMLGAILLLFVQVTAIQENVACSVLFGFIQWYVIEAALSVLLNAVDRYVYISYGLYYAGWMTTKRTRYLLIATWIFSLLTGFIPELLFSKPTGKNCLYFSSTPLFVILITIFAAFLPFVITVLLYVSISITANKVRKRIHKIRTIEGSSSARNSIGLSTNSTIDVGCGSSRTELVQEKEDLKSKSIKKTKKTPVFCISLKQIDNINFIPTLRDNSMVVTKDDRELNEGDSSVDNRNHTSNIEENNAINEGCVYKISSTKEIEKYNCTSNLNILLIISTFTIAWGPCIACLLTYPIFCISYQQSETCVMFEKILFLLVINFGLISLLITPIIYWWFYARFRSALLKVCFKNTVREKRRRDFVTALKK